MSITETTNSNPVAKRPKSAAGAGNYSRTRSPLPADELGRVFARQRAAFGQHPAPSLAERKATLLKLQRIVEQNRVLFIEAANADFGTRASAETEISEIAGTVSMIRHMRRNLRSWMAPRRRSAALWHQPARNRVEPRPRGVVGVVAPWNFPLHLALVPAATALAAGNRVMIKVSEFTPRTSAVLQRLIQENFRPEVLHVSNGSGDVAAAFTRLPFDHLLSTGSTQTGKLVAEAAAEYLTPVTLELGGKSPVIVDQDYSIEEAASHVARAKLHNGGQVSLSPDFAVVPRGREMDFAIAVRHAARNLFPRAAGNPQYTAVLNQQHYDRLRAYISEAQSRGLEVVTTEDLALGKDRRQLPLTLIINPPDDAAVMQEEIFGPVLPVIGYDNEHTAIEYLNARPPLALYVFANAKSHQKRWLERVTSGSAVVNDLMIGCMQGDLPFGGIGASGYGRYHGREGFDAMSQLRPVAYQRTVFGHKGRQVLIPPYGRSADLLIKLMRRI